MQIFPESTKLNVTWNKTIDTKIYKIKLEALKPNDPRPVDCPSPEHGEDYEIVTDLSHSYTKLYPNYQYRVTVIAFNKNEEKVGEGSKNCATKSAGM